MTTVNTLYNDLGHIDAMKEHLAIRKQQHAETADEFFEKQRAFMELDSRLANLTRQANKENAEPWMKRELAEVQAEYDRLNEEKEQLLRRQQELDEEITLQQKAIDNSHLVNPIMFNEVKDHQVNMDKAVKEIDRLKKLITDQHPIIRSLLTAEVPLQSLLQQKEDTLADIATGASSEKELDDINQQIGLVLANIEQAKEKADRAKAAQIGLERKLDDAKQVLAALEAKNQSIVEGLLRTLAEEEGQRYFKLADQLEKSFTRLMGFHGLIQQQTPKRNGICLNYCGLILPGFNLECAKQYMKKTDPVLFDWQSKAAYGNGVQIAMGIELQAIRDAGVTIL
ncbi:MAG: hypothetical protein Q7U57_08110 [Methylovulum sp.]|nr:hypothetical protein [Methylovulum sp.]